MKRTSVLILSLFILISNVQAKTLVDCDTYREKNCDIYLEEDVTINEELIFRGNCYIDGAIYYIDGDICCTILKVNNHVRIEKKACLKLENVIFDCSDGSIEDETLDRIELIGNNAYIIFPKRC